MTAPAPKIDAHVARMIATAQSCGLTNYKVTKRGREIGIEVKTGNDPETDELAAKIERMAADASR